MNSYDASDDLVIESHRIEGDDSEKTDISKKVDEADIITEEILRKKKILAKLNEEIEKKKQKHSKIKVLLGIEREKLLLLKEKIDKKYAELESVKRQIENVEDKMGDTVMEISSEEIPQQEIKQETQEQKPIPVQNARLDDMELQFLIREIDSYIENAYLHSGTEYKKKIGSLKDVEPVTQDFFRTKDRIDNSILLFQYLIFFGRDVDFSAVDVRDLSKHYRQFKDVMIYFFSFLDETDVKSAIHRELLKGESSTESVTVQMENRLKEIQAMIRERIIRTDHITKDNFFELFDILKTFMQFWFEIKNYDINRIRKNDIYIYNLLKHLLSFKNKAGK